MPELITDGRNGFLVGGVDGAVAAVAACDALDRPSIRDDAVARFDRSVMVDRYVEVYRQILAR